MSSLEKTCPACQQTGLASQGRLLDRQGAFTLADPGNLYSCKRCGLSFRSPYPDEKELSRLYNDMPAGLWSEKDRPDQDLARQAIARRLKTGRVFDVGCFRGDFLMSLPPGMVKYGVEPSREAASVAKSRGINILGNTLAQVAPQQTGFDCAALLDVMEHLTTPLDALVQVNKLLCPGGLVVVTTGNTRALAWRILGLHYWYYFPEHVSFFQPRWFAWASRQLGWKVLETSKFSRFHGTSTEKWRQLAAALVFETFQKASPRSPLHRFLSRVPKVRRAASWTEAPWTNLWPDHMLVVMKKTLAGGGK